MPNFVFWNVAGKAVPELIASLALSNDVDLLVLAECSSDPNGLLKALNRDSPDFQYAPGTCRSLFFFTKFDSQFLTPAAETPRVSIRRLRLPARQDLLVVGAHLPSKMHFSEGSQIFQCTELAKLIEEQETKVGHKRTVVLGDLNVNPFEHGVIGSGGLHAVSTRAIAERGSRVVQGKSYSFFYNPMWSYFGDRNETTPGTYYYEKAESVNYFWNVFDQILIRPDMLNGLDKNGVRVLTKIGETSLVDEDGKPDGTNVSDHLPIFLSVRF